MSYWRSKEYYIRFKYHPVNYGAWRFVQPQQVVAPDYLAPTTHAINCLCMGARSFHLLRGVVERTAL